MERAGKIQDRTEESQERGSRMMLLARWTLLIILPVVIILVLYIS